MSVIKILLLLMEFPTHLCVALETCAITCKVYEKLDDDFDL